MLVYKEIKMDEGIKATYIKILKHGWKIKRSLFDRIIYRLTKRYKYYIEGDETFKKTEMTMYLTQRINVNLPSKFPPKEFTIHGFINTKNKFYNLPT